MMIVLDVGLAACLLSRHHKLGSWQLKSFNEGWVLYYAV